MPFKSIPGWYPLLVGSGLLLAILAFDVSAGLFGLGKSYEVQLFPAVEGRVTKGGVPLAGASVVREATYDDAEIQQTLTDADGRFGFPAWTIRSRTPGKSLVEDRLRQVIVVEHEGWKYLLWYYVTGRINGEQVVAEKLKSLECDLDDQELSYHFPKAENPSFTHNIGSICRW